MPYQSRPSERTVELVKAAGGSIWTTTTNTVAGGALVARAEIENMYVPDKAKTLLGWRPCDHATAFPAAQSTVAVFDISGGNYNFQPQEVICGCVAESNLGATGATVPAPPEYYDVFAPVAGGEQISIGIEPCDALTGDRRCGAEFTWTDARLNLPTIRSYCSREVAGLDVAGVFAGTTLTITHAHELIEVGGVATHAAIAAAEELDVTLILKCTALPVNEIRVMFNPPGELLGAITASTTTTLTRRLERLKFSQESASVFADFDVDVALAAAGQVVHYIRYI